MSITKNVKFKNSYTLEELYEAIKDHPFEAGVPALAKQGPGLLIVFPEIDSHNQVQIIKGSLFGKSSQKFIVQKCEAVGLGNLVKNVGLDLLTDSWANKRTIIGKSARESSELVDITAQELEELGL